MKLIQLQNGSWVDATTVTSVTAAPATPSVLGTTIKARVIVRHGPDHNSSAIVVYEDSDERAVEVADEIALLVNTAIVEQQIVKL